MLMNSVFPQLPCHRVHIVHIKFIPVLDCNTCNINNIHVVAEQLFGGALSSSDDEVGPTINIMDEDDDSRLSVDDSRFSESYLVSYNCVHGSRYSLASSERCTLSLFSVMFNNSVKWCNSTMSYYGLHEIHLDTIFFL